MNIFKKFSGFILFIFLSLPNIALGYENSVYIWQRNWDEKITDSVRSLSSVVSHYAILCGDIRGNEGRLTLTRVPVDLNYLKGTSKITLCFRVHSEVASLLEEKGSSESTLKTLKIIADQLALSAKENGALVEEIQFDYDCPTRRLAGYIQFMESARAILKPYKISITALPTWLKERDFKKLIALTDNYVLQLHFFEKPKTILEAKEIFNSQKAFGYLKKASALNHHFYVSLPTYGYEVMYDPRDGHFIGLRAENMSIAWDKNTKTETVSTNPDDVLQFLQSAYQLKSDRLNGFYWFRLPLETDQFNWNILTLKKILNNEAPKVGTSTTIKRSDDGLCEIYLLNTGERDIVEPSRIKVTWQASSNPIYDVLGKYEGTPSGNGVLLQGPAPRVGESLLVAWFREMDPQKHLILNVDGVTK